MAEYVSTIKNIFRARFLTCCLRLMYMLYFLSVSVPKERGGYMYALPYIPWKSRVWWITLVYIITWLQTSAKPWPRQWWSNSLIAYRWLGWGEVTIYELNYLKEKNALIPLAIVMTASVNDTFPHGRQAPIYPTWAIQMLLLTCKLKENDIYSHTPGNPVANLEKISHPPRDV